MNLKANGKTFKDFSAGSIWSVFFKKLKFALGSGVGGRRTKTRPFQSSR